jgi:hypothetical protein
MLQPAGATSMHLAAKSYLGILLASVWVGVAYGQPLAATPQSDIRVVSSLVAPGDPVPEICRDEARILARTLIRYPLPPAWHWVLVCDEPGWRRFLRLSGREEHTDIYASTDLLGHATYLRGVNLLNQLGLNVNADEIISHELGHIWLQTTDETRASVQAWSWRQSQPRSPQ